MSPSHHIPEECEAPSDSPTSMALSENAFGGEFMSSDIGYVGITGSSFYTPRSWVVVGSGSNIWAEVDGFHYLYLPTQGDVRVTTLINSFQATNVQASGGIMFRDSLAANSSHYSMLITGSEGLSTTYRECYGCSSMNDQSGAAAQVGEDNIWLRVTKEGTSHNTHYKHVGATDWTLLGSTKNITYTSDTFYIGFAASASDNAKAELLCGTNFELNRHCPGSNGKDSCATVSSCMIVNVIVTLIFNNFYLINSSVT
jgi:hypothetical protein